MRVLLTNDDGVDAPGLRALATAVADLCDATIVAPDQHLSGCGHRVTTDRILRAEQLAPQRYALDGTPADCTRVGLLELAPDVEWVFAGLNAGGNLGIDTYMSGTVAAVREATLWGRRGIAFSQYRSGPGEIDWDSTVPVLQRVLEWIRSQPHEAGTFWNVNLPDLGRDTVHAPIRECPLDTNPVDVRFEVSQLEFRYRGVYQKRPHAPGTDVQHCFAGAITVTQCRP